MGQKSNWGRKADSKDSTRALVRVGELEASWGRSCVSTSFQSRQCCIRLAPRASVENQVRQEASSRQTRQCDMVGKKLAVAGLGSRSWVWVEVKIKGTH